MVLFQSLVWASSMDYKTKTYLINDLMPLMVMVSFICTSIFIFDYTYGDDSSSVNECNKVINYCEEYTGGSDPKIIFGVLYQVKDISTS